MPLKFISDHLSYYQFMFFLLMIILTPLAAAELQTWATLNGVRVYFYYTDALPMVDIRVLVDAGSVRDDDKPGVAAMTAELLAHGAKGNSADDIATKIESVGSQYSIGSTRDYAWLNLRSLTTPEALQISIKTMANILSAPDFGQDEIEWVQEQMLLELEEVQQSPGLIARRTFNKAVFEGHPYGRYAEADDIKSITRISIKKFYKKYYVSNNTVLAITGKLSRKQAENIANGLMGKFPEGEKALPITPVEPLKKSKTIRIDYPSKQTHILMGQPGYKRGSLSHYALYIANHHFGGSGSSSLLTQEVRERRGLAYSVYSYFSLQHEKGFFLIGVKTKNSNAKEVARIIEKNLQKYIEIGISESAFHSSVQNITGGFALRTDTNRELVTLAAAIGFFGLPLNYVEEYQNNIRAQSIESVREEFRNLIDANKLIKVIVGGS